MQVNGRPIYHHWADMLSSDFYYVTTRESVQYHMLIVRIL